LCTNGERNREGTRGNRQGIGHERNREGEGTGEGE